MSVMMMKSSCSALRFKKCLDHPPLRIGSAGAADLHGPTTTRKHSISVRSSSWLQVELERAIDRSQLDLDFYTRQYPANTAVAQTQIQAYQRILAWLELLKVEAIEVAEGRAEQTRA